MFKGNNKFVMYEDNGKTDFENHTAETVFTNEYNSVDNSVKLTIEVQGDTSVIPKNRQYKICFKDIDCEDFVVDYSDEPIVIEISNPMPYKKEELRDRVITIMSRWQDSTFKKQRAYKPFENVTDKNSLFRVLHSSKLPKPVFNMIYEALSGCYD